MSGAERYRCCHFLFSGFFHSPLANVTFADEDAQLFLSHSLVLEDSAGQRPRRLNKKAAARDAAASMRRGGHAKVMALQTAREREQRRSDRRDNEEVRSGGADAAGATGDEGATASRDFTKIAAATVVADETDATSATLLHAAGEL